MKLIKTLKKTVMLELDNGYRFYVPVEIYNDPEMTEEDYIENSIPYSLSFELILEDVVDFEKVELDLYARGIHTLDDIIKNRKPVNDILRANLSATTIIRGVNNGNTKITL